MDHSGFFLDPAARKEPFSACKSFEHFGFLKWMDHGIVIEFSSQKMGENFEKATR
jgi:hypothetical protein